MKTKKKQIAVLGAGISGLSCASFLAKAGHEVSVFEKHEVPGGRARKFETDNGFVFDMGPSWYWMPEIFEEFYQTFGHTAADFYQLKRLDPSYQIIWKDSLSQIPAHLEELEILFESIEKGSAVKLQKFLKAAAKKYHVGMGEFVLKPSLKWTEFVSLKVLKGALSLDLLTSYSSYIRKFFSHPKLISILEFPILFLGARPQDTPALYSLMNYADLKLGTWYPLGGMFELVKAFEQIALEQGVKINYQTSITGFTYTDKNITEVHTDSGTHAFDYVVSSMDYQFTESLLGNFANYSETYWDSRVLAPSSLIFYLGIEGTLPKLEHHNLFFDEDFNQHALEIYKNPVWPSKPLFYVCCPSKTDLAVAPPNHENLFILIPLAPDLEDTHELRERCFQKILKRLNKHLEIPLENHIVFQRSYCIQDFKTDYHAFKGNANGLANTLSQTAVLKPQIKNKKLKNLYYTGQLTVPGPGLPPAVISGEVVAKEVLKTIKNEVRYT